MNYIVLILTSAANLIISHGPIHYLSVLLQSVYDSYLATSGATARRLNNGGTGTCVI